MAKVEYHFDFGSPNAYLAHLGNPGNRTADRCQFRVLCRCCWAACYKLTGNRSPGESLAGVKNKPDYERLETARFISATG